MSEAVGRKLVKVSVEVRSGTARFRVGVWAQSMRKAIGLVGAKYPQGEVRLVLPIKPEGFFVREPAASSGTPGAERASAEAA